MKNREPISNGQWVRTTVDGRSRLGIATEVTASGCVVELPDGYVGRSLEEVRPVKRARSTR
jgi:hypothetical protein